MSSRPNSPARTNETNTNITASRTDTDASRHRTQILPTATTDENLTQTGHTPFELPPLPQAPSSPRHGSFPPGLSRSASVSNILNPADHYDQLQHGRRRKASELASPPSSRPQLPPLPAEVHVSTTRSPSLSTGVLPAFSPNVNQHGRRILTPRSPSLHRTASLNHPRAHTGFFDAQSPPIPPSPHMRTYTVEPGRGGVPPLPATILSARPSYSQAPSVARSRAVRPPNALEERARSTSLSPRSGYPQLISPAPTSVRSDPTFRQRSSALSQSTQSYGPDVDHNEPHSGLHMVDQRPGGIPITPTTGQSSFQMMTLQTTSGTVQLPVEVQAASRVADEKRRRNAGASARFRARRKEKEKESSVTIAKLEMQVKELSEDVEFYRRERGYLASIVLQTPGGERHFPRPTSPRHHRPTSIQLGASRSTSVGYMSDPNVPQSPGERRNVRRRTSTISLPMPDSSSISTSPANPAGPSIYGTSRYDIAPLSGSRNMARPSLPGPASLLAPAPLQQAQYSQAPQRETSWSAYGSGSSTAAGTEGLSQTFHHRRQA